MKSCVRNRPTLYQHALQVDALQAASVILAAMVALATARGRRNAHLRATVKVIMTSEQMDVAPEVGPPAYQLLVQQQKQHHHHQQQQRTLQPKHLVRLSFSS